VAVLVCCMLNRLEHIVVSQCAASGLVLCVCVCVSIMWL